VSVEARGVLALLQISGVFIQDHNKDVDEVMATSADMGDGRCTSPLIRPVTRLAPLGVVKG
jgi:hypothetical protein